MISETCKTLGSINTKDVKIRAVNSYPHTWTQWASTEVVPLLQELL